VEPAVNDVERTERRSRVLVCDDHPVMRQALCAAISTTADFTVAGEATNGREAVDAYGALLPDVTMMDLQMPVMDGLGAIALIRSQHPSASILILTTYPGDERAKRAIELGALGCLVKTAGLKEIHDALRAAVSGV
jgi:DNA-binding NarL/FixJ family response regulator